MSIGKWVIWISLTVFGVLFAPPLQDDAWAIQALAMSCWILSSFLLGTWSK